MRRFDLIWLLAIPLSVTGVIACSSEDGPSSSSSLGNDGDGNGSGDGDGGSGGGLGAGGHEPTALDDRVIDYNEALRTASLKLNDRLPTLEQIRQVADADDKPAAYEALVDGMLEDPAFARRMVRWWKDTMLQGGGADGDAPSRNTAPTFAARVVVESFDDATGTFADGDCQNGVDVHAGVLTNPGVMHQFYGNMAFRRVRWVQEIFVCSKFPAEISGTPIDKGGKDYLSPWPFDALPTAPIDFLDYESVVCANCHSTMNHLAPLFANFDANGQLQGSIQVMTPLSPEPVPTELGHWLVPGEVTAWRHEQPVADLPALGQALANDPEVKACAVTRMWNFVMSKPDVVNDLSTVPFEVVEDFYDEFDASGYDLKAALRMMLLSQDFVSF
jgi:hypothetical protein